MNINGNNVSEIIALNIALKRSEGDWFEKLPTNIKEALVKSFTMDIFFAMSFIRIML